MFEIIGVTDFEVTIKDEDRHISHVHQQGDGKWRCQRCNRLWCEHATFVAQSGVQLLPKQPIGGDDIEILTY